MVDGFLTKTATGFQLMDIIDNISLIKISLANRQNLGQYDTISNT